VPVPLHILHLIDKNRLNTGSAVQMMDAARSLVVRGHQVSVAGRPHGDLEGACARAGVSFTPLRLSGPADLHSAMRLRRHLRRRSISIVHVHKGGPHAVALIASAGLGRTPVVVVNRGVSFPLDILNKWKYHHPRVGAICCVADAVREVVARSGGLPPENVLTIHAGTDTTVFDPLRANRRSVREELGLENNHLLVGQASVRDWRGWRQLFAAFAEIAPRQVDARLLLVGCELSDRQKINRLGNDLGVGDRLDVFPFRRDMPEVLAACDVVVDASLRGTGITGSIREAMAMECAVVATECGGNSELVVDGEVGLLVPPGDTTALAGALDRLLGEPDLRRGFGIAARKRVVEHLSTEKRIDRLEALYRRVLE
jgi:glycosyltransferase involved in cell wall biosynthesis